MTAECFLDTNVLVYAAARDSGPKRRRARELISDADWGLSVQVLQEFYVTVTRKVSVPLAPLEAWAWLEQLEEFPCVHLDRGIVRLGVELSRRYGISYWDAAIVAAAEQLGAATLYSEDLNHGQLYGPVQVLNPFLDR
jgi:predicted nucleic acid-binding protein